MSQSRTFIIRTEAIRQRLIEFLLSLPLSELWSVVISIYDPTRSREQNDLAWLVVTAIADQVKPNGQRFHKDVWWLQLKREHFGPKIIELPDGSFIEQEPDSHSRGKKKFSEFLEFLFWRSSDLGVQLPEDAHQRHWMEMSKNITKEKKNALEETIC